ncbi:MAG TPA: Ig-like domain repeat protein [Terriglobales bacterium]|nr:Ig-like domain repeat protein [Terriglobales bacterium]
MAQSTAIQPRITQAVDEQKLVRLAGNTHPLAQSQYDRGIAPDSLPAQRMLLVLQRGPDQEAALRRLLEDQQTKSSPQYHRWLTPEEFGKQFGPADADIAVVTNWLQTQGFHVARVAAGRTVIEFSGTAGLVRQAFHTEIHKFVVNGEEHWANAGDPQIPAALAPVMRGIASLHNFRIQPAHRQFGTFTRPRQTEGTPLFTFQSCGPNGTQNCYAVGPGDFAVIYNVQPLWQAGIDGTGQSIAIVARTNINLQDVRDFRNLFGLPANDPVIVFDGPDPGLVPGDESEALLDAQLSGAVAKGATINLVVSESTEVADGVELSALYAIENNIAPVLSVSFSACEAALGSTGNSVVQALWQQGAAQGITVSVAAGDSGSAGCDDFTTQATATQGLAVNGLASTPYNVAVGGTDFDDVSNPTTYWSSSNQSTPTALTSAMSYIPEVPLNDSCAQVGVSGGCTSPPGSQLQNIFAGGGGPSNCSTSTSGGVCLAGTAKPAWQGGTGVPADNVRDIPDVSLFAGDGLNNSFYVVCEADITAPLSCGSSPTISFLATGGTSASAQAFAGIMALVNHKQATMANPTPRQGNANFVLYPLAANNAANCNSSTTPTTNSTCTFYDITKGNNSVPCTSGSPNCGSTAAGRVLVDPAHTSTPAWTTTAGFDRATGLGSVNVNNLATNWNTVSFKGTTTTLTNLAPTTITHGQTVNLTATVAANNPPGTPTGAVALMGTPNNVQLGIDGPFPLTNGTTVNASTKFLPGGTNYPVFVRYGGDGAFGGSDSTPPVMVTVSPEISNTFLHLVTFDQFGNAFFTVTTTPYGSPYVLRADVTNATDGFQTFPACSTGCPTGTVTIKDNGQPLDGGTFALNAAGHTEDQSIQLPAGNHPLTATYSGDNSFNASGPANLSVTITQATTSLATVTATGTGVQTLNLSTTVQTQSSGVAPSGTVTFLDNGAAVTTGTVVQNPMNCCANGFASLQVARVGATISTTPGAHQITATYGGDSNYLSSSTTAAAALTVGVSVQAPAVAVARGMAANANITLTSTYGFSGTAAVACTIPVGMNEATCTPATQNVNVSSGGQAFVTVNIATTAPHAVGGLLRGSRWASFGLVLAGGAFLLAVPARKRRSNVLLMLLTLVILAASLFACGGGGSGAVQDPGTAPGTYQVGITVTSGGTNIGSGTVAVTVQ